MTLGLILVVDGIPADLQAACSCLETIGHFVLSATGPVEALSHLRTFRPHAILLAVPDPDGCACELARGLKADSATSGIPIVALTAGSDGDASRRAREAGCDAWLAKPVDAIRLRGVLDVIVPA